jgi:hypothetical protein
MNKGVVDSSCGGVLMEKSNEEAMELFETLSDHSQLVQREIRSKE